MSSHESSAATTEISVASKELASAPEIGVESDSSTKATAKSISEATDVCATSAAGAATGAGSSGISSTETRKPNVNSAAGKTNPEAKNSRAGTESDSERTAPKGEDRRLVGETTGGTNTKETDTKAEPDETSTVENADEPAVDEKPKTWVDPDNPANFIPPGWMSREEYDKKRKIVEVEQRRKFAAIEPKEVLPRLSCLFQFEKIIVLYSLIAT